MENNDAAFISTNQSHPWAIWLAPGSYEIVVDEWKQDADSQKTHFRIIEYKKAPAEAMDFFASENYKETLYSKAAQQKLAVDSINFYFMNYLWSYAQKVKANSLLQYYVNSLTNDTYIIAFLKKLQNLQNNKNLTARQKQMAHLLKGKKLDNFILKTHQDSLFTLYDIKAKYILLDFWASWCGPCRRKHPYFVSLYQKYESKGFTIISISFDEKKQEWVNAITNDKLSWKNVSELKGINNSLSKKYGITQIPFNIFLNSQFEIVTTDASLGVMEAFLKEMK